jgi:hypothetical protein
MHLKQGWTIAPRLRMLKEGALESSLICVEPELVRVLAHKYLGEGFSLNAYWTGF